MGDNKCVFDGKALQSDRDDREATPVQKQKGLKVCTKNVPSAAMTEWRDTGPPPPPPPPPVSNTLKSPSGGSLRAPPTAPPGGGEGRTGVFLASCRTTVKDVKTDQSCCSFGCFFTRFSNLKQGSSVTNHIRYGHSFSALRFKTFFCLNQEIT